MERVAIDLPADLEADLEAYCRMEYVHREEAIRRLLTDWLETRRDEASC